MTCFTLGYKKLIFASCCLIRLCNDSKSEHPLIKKQHYYEKTNVLIVGELLITFIDKSPRE